MDATGAADTASAAEMGAGTPQSLPSFLHPYLVNAVVTGKTTALHLAAEAGDEQCVRWLLQEGASCRVFDRVARLSASGGGGATEVSGDTPLLTACRAEQLACARLILGRAEGRETLDWKSRSRKKDTALTVSVLKKNVELVRVCLEAGADPNLRTLMGTTALYLACSGGSVECTRLCLQHGGLATTRCDECFDEDGRCCRWTPLHIAAWNGHAGCVRACAEAGASLEGRLWGTDEDDDEEAERSTPLALAVRHWELETVKELCFGGARRYPRDVALEEANRQVDAGSAEDDEDDEEWNAPAIRDWLQRTRGFATPLCYVEYLSAERVRDMLRHSRCGRGALIRWRDHPDEQSVCAVQCARRLTSSLPAVALVLRAAEPWSSRTHDVWSDATHALVWPILCIGYALANERCQGSVHAFVDAWRDIVMPQLFARA
jgi:ankyrin repeat protein